MTDGGTTRDRMLAAVVEILLNEGFEGLSIRKVAAASATSIGAVQHHFPTKTALLAASVETVDELAAAEIETALRSEDDPTRRLRAFCGTVVGLTDPSLTGSRIYLLWLARTLVDADLAARHQRGWQEVEDVTHRLILDATGRRTSRATRDEAALLVSVLDGLAYGSATEPGRLSLDRAARLLDRHLDALLLRLA